MAGRRGGVVPARGRRSTGKTGSARRCSRRSSCATWQLSNRVVVSPMAQYKAVDGCPTDWHFSHYAERAKGGAGLVYIEMTCVSPEGRITPGCPGFYAPEHEVAWKRLVDFVHRETEAKICAQIGHSGPKGSTQLGWERATAAAEQDNWPVMRGLRRRVVAAQPGAEADDPRRHGSGARPVRGVGRDGGALRLRHAGDPRRAWLPAVVLHHAADQPPHRRRMAGRWKTACAIRWRSSTRCARCGRLQKPISVRISANDWVGSDGVTPAEAVEIARMLAAAGRRHLRRLGGPDLDPRQAGLWPHVPDAVLRPHPQRDRHGDRWRVGNIFEPDHVNSILMAGRADLVCLARPHLADPYWTLHAARDARTTAT